MSKPRTIRRNSLGARCEQAAWGIAVASRSWLIRVSLRLVAAHWLRTFNTGQLETVRMWLDALPAELVATDASLAAARVLLALDTGHLEEVSGALDVAEASSPANTRLMFLRALHMYKTRDVGGAMALLRAISPAAHDAFVSTVHRLILGVAGGYDGGRTSPSWSRTGGTRRGTGG